MQDRWSRKHAHTQRRLCERFAAPVINVITCQDITTGHTQQIVNAAPTAGEGDRVQGMISALVAAGIEGGYLTNPRLAKVHWQAGKRPLPAQRVTVAGESGLWVDPAEIPADDDIGKLGQALAEGRHGERDELMASTAAYSGLRWGELTALTIPHADLRAQARGDVRQDLPALGTQPDGRGPEESGTGLENTPGYRGRRTSADRQHDAWRVGPGGGHDASLRLRAARTVPVIWRGGIAGCGIRCLAVRRALCPVASRRRVSFADLTRFRIGLDGVPAGSGLAHHKLPEVWGRRRDSIMADIPSIYLSVDGATARPSFVTSPLIRRYAPQRIVLRQPNSKAADAPGGR